VTSVIVVEDHPIYRRGLAQTLDALEDLELRGAFRSMEDLGQSGAVADVVLLDLHLPGLEGAPAVAHLVGEGRKVIVVTGSVELSDVLGALGEGAMGYVSKDAEETQILEAIRTVVGGASYVSPTLAACLLGLTDQELPLTSRERQVLELLAEGASDKAIARELAISIRTVHSHLEAIREKTGKRRRVDLTRFALDRGIVSRREVPGRGGPSPR